MPYRQDAACTGRFRSMPATNSGMLIGLAGNGGPWISEPVPVPNSEAGTTTSGRLNVIKGWTHFDCTRFY